MLKRRLTAFTLLELLVVMAIIGLLAAIMFPVTSKVLATSRATDCTANLYAIHKAYTMRHRDHILGKAPDRLPNSNWAVLLGPYLTQDEATLRCREDHQPHYAGGLDHLRLWLKTSSLDCGTAPLHPGRYNRPNRSSQGIEDPPDSGNYYKVVVEKTSGTIDEKSEWEILVRHLKRERNTRNEDDKPPEMHHKFKISTKDQTVTPLMVGAENGGASFNTTFGYIPLLDAADQNEVAILYDSDTQPATKIPLGKPLDLKSFHFEAVSYGCTDYAEFDVLSRPRILMMDYGQNTIDARSQTNWDLGPKPYPFVRHKRRANVLFGDGSVQALDATTIKPSDTNALVEFWAP